MAVAMHNSFEEPGLLKACDQQGITLSIQEAKSVDSVGSENNKSPKSVLQQTESREYGSEEDRSLLGGRCSLAGQEESVSIVSEKSSTTSQLPRPGFEEQAPALMRGVSRKSMTAFIREDWVECYASCTIDGPSSNATSTEDASPPASTRNLPLEMSVMMEQMTLQMEESLRDHKQQSEASHRDSNNGSNIASTRSYSIDNLDDLEVENHHPSSFTDSDAGSSCDEMEEEIEEIIDDMLLNNMERQWHGKDFLMEHISDVAAMNKSSQDDGESLPSQHYESF